ncbi:MAG: hypothetical protein K9M75_07180, partial [Phycisphaerae bacterium]|nr:hypothetical protein [Phycisphaerae bacterium]
MRNKKLVMLAMVMAIILTTSAGAKVIFTESFENPDLTVTTTKSPGTWQIVGFANSRDGAWPGWVGAGQKYIAVRDKSVNVPGDEMFINSFGDQALYVFNNIPSGDTQARLTTTADSLDVAIEANTTYTLKLNTASSRSNEIEYHVELIAISGGGAETVLATAREFITSNDLAANPVILTYKSGENPAKLGERIAVRLRKGIGTYFHDIYYDNIVLKSDKMNVSPDDGEVVGGGTVDLSWTNMDPNVGDTVYVDVMFGTEPNSALPGYDMQKVLTGAANATTTQVTAAAGGTYYWQIISYLNGEAVTDPCESDVYSFTTASDLGPQLVDILTPDMVTWSDEPVSLTSNVVDDGASALT